MIFTNECRKCHKKKLKSTIKYLPNQFTLCLQNKDSPKDWRDKLFPLLNEHYIDSVIQYNPQTQHFRTIFRNVKEDTIIISDSTVPRKISLRFWNQLLNHNHCKSYIFLIRRKFTNPKPTLISLTDYKRYEIHYQTTKKFFVGKG